MLKSEPLICKTLNVGYCKSHRLLKGTNKKKKLKFPKNIIFDCNTNAEITLKNTVGR